MKCYSIVLSALFLAVPAHSINKNNLNRPVLYNTVTAAATISFLLWVGPTIEVINKSGVLVAIGSTHIPRLVLDLATITACQVARHDHNKSDKDRRLEAARFSPGSKNKR